MKQVCLPCQWKTVLVSTKVGKELCPGEVFSHLPCVQILFFKKCHSWVNVWMYLCTSIFHFILSLLQLPSFFWLWILHLKRPFFFFPVVGLLYKQNNADFWNEKWVYSLQWDFPAQRVCQARKEKSSIVVTPSSGNNASTIDIYGPVSQLILKVQDFIKFNHVLRWEALPRVRTDGGTWTSSCSTLPAEDLHKTKLATIPA